MKFMFLVTVTSNYVNDSCHEFLNIFQTITSKKSTNKGSICIYQFYSFDHVSTGYPERVTQCRFWSSAYLLH